MKQQSPVMFPLNLQCEVAVRTRSECLGSSAVPVRRTTQQPAFFISYFVNIFRWDIEIALVKHDVIVGVFSVLNRTEQRIGAAAQQNVEGTKMAMPLINPCQADDAQGRDQLDQKNCRNQSSRYGVGFHAEPSRRAIKR